MPSEYVFDVYSDDGILLASIPGRGYAEAFCTALDVTPADCGHTWTWEGWTDYSGEQAFTWRGPHGLAELRYVVKVA